MGAECSGAKRRGTERSGAPRNEAERSERCEGVSDFLMPLCVILEHFRPTVEWPSGYFVTCIEMRHVLILNNGAVHEP